MKNAAGKWTNHSLRRYYEEINGRLLQAAKGITLLTVPGAKRENKKENVRMRESRVSPCLGMLSWGPLVVAGLLLCSGCGDGKIARYPVSGTVLVDGKPAEGVVVVLCPTEGTPEFKKERPYGTTDAAGKFQTMTFSPNDGAPSGTYKVMIQWPKQNGDALQGRYFDLESSTLTATVEEAATDLPPFQLTTR